MLGAEWWCVVCVCVCARVCVCVCVCVVCVCISSKVKMKPRPQQRWRTEVPVYSGSQITEVMKDCSLIIPISKIISFEHFKSLVLLFIKPI